MESIVTSPAPDLVETLQLGKSPARRRRIRHWLIGIGLAVAVTIVIATTSVIRGRAEAIHYVTQPVTRGNLTVRVSATGTIQPTDQVEIGSEISGTIKTVDVDYNDTVQKGQVLAALDTSRLRAQVQQSQAALQSAEAKVLQALATRQETTAQLARLTRMHELTKGDVPSETDLDAARATRERADADVASAKALVAQSRATLDAQQTDLAKAVIRSPIDGIVLTRSVEPGQTVAATLQAPVLFVLAENLRQMELHVDVDEADVSQVKTGQAALFTVDAYPDREFSAEVTQVRYGAQTVGGVVTYEAVLTVDNSTLALRPGMTATAEIVVHEVHDALLAPNVALRFSPPAQAEEQPASGGLMSNLLPHMPRTQASRQDSQAGAGVHQVWTLRDGKAVSFPVRTGVTDGTMTQIESGDVQAGTPLIVESKASGS